MKILFVASEAVPFCKTGGLADVVGTLAQKLGEAGHEVRLFLPKYRGLKGGPTAWDWTADISVPLGGSAVSVGLKRFRHGAVTICFVEHPAFFDRDGLYADGGRDYADNDLRFALFARAALEGVKAQGWSPDVVHAHDWQAGLVCAHLKRGYRLDPCFAGTSAVFTVHHMAYQGLFPRASLEAAGFGPEDWTQDGMEYYGQTSYLKAGLAYADRLTTVSPTYAREIQESGQRGFGFEGLLRRRSSVLSGILNGLDTEAWNPAQDAFLAERYDSSGAAAGKAVCKEALQRECGLRVRPDLPLLGVVSRLDYQKGLDLALAAVEPILDGVQLVVLGAGDPALSEAFEALGRRHALAVHFHRRFDEERAHRVYAASDFFLMPSRSEPCGLGQMIAMRYGAVPVVARTGGLVDTVFETPGVGAAANGFLCEPNDASSLASALARALRAYRGPLWAALVGAGMAGDFSWDRSMRSYLGVYRQAALR